MYQALDCSLPSAARSEDLSSIPGPRTNHNKSRIPGGSCHPSTASTSAFQGNDYFQIQVLRCNIQTGDVVFYLIISQIEDSVLTPTIFCSRHSLTLQPFCCGTYTHRFSQQLTAWPRAVVQMRTVRSCRASIRARVTSYRGMVLKQ